MAATNPNFIHGNWNPARSSSSNIFVKSAKNSKKGSSKCPSHEYPIIFHQQPSVPRGAVGSSNCYPNEEAYPSSHCQTSGYDSDVSSGFIGTKFGFQYRSNPQISFASSIDNTTSTDDFDTLSTTYDKSSCNPVRLAVTRNSNRNKRDVFGGSGNTSHQQIQKWKNELTAAASNIPRKWCDFVFRRNEDNRVYRSESFRFIQKTNSLALLTPASSDGQRFRNKRISHHGISVSDDYVDPVDHVLNAPVPHYSNRSVIQGAWSASSTCDDTSSGSGSRNSDHTSSGRTGTNLCGQHESGDINNFEPPYNEIAEHYNAPYYYSDTIKEPTYISPCEDGGLLSPGSSSLSNTSSPSPVLSEILEPVTVTIVTGSLLREREKSDRIDQPCTAEPRKHYKLNRRAAYLRGTSRELMARKRYETAFLPSSSPHASSQTTPDIDSLLLAIESSCQLGHGYVSKTDITQPNSALCGCLQEVEHSPDSKESNDRRETSIKQSQENAQTEGVEKRVICISHSPKTVLSGTAEVSQSVPMTQSAMSAASSDLPSQTTQSYHFRSSIVKSSEASGSNSSLQTNPSASFCQSHHFQHHHHPNHLHQNLNINLAPSRSSGLCTTTNSSPLSTHKLASKPMMPLSEPLPQKRYITKSNSSSSHTTTSSTGPSESRRLGHNLKDNSVSSLESIDSTKSEELSSSLHRPSSHFCGSHYSTNYQPQKLLSPISDKSPLEPVVVLANSHQKEFGGTEENNANGAKWANNVTLLNAAELTNVPWEMPKLRRKLAKLADSGISLDFSGSGSKETDCPTTVINYLSGSGGRASLDLSLGVGSGGSQTGGVQGKGKRDSASNSLQLSFDDNLTRDEYYEDPTYMTHEGGAGATFGPSKQGFLTASKIPGSAIVEDVTSVQVHVSHPEGKPTSSTRPDRCRMKLDFSSTKGFGGGGLLFSDLSSVIDPNIELERQDWFHGAITRCEAESILRATKEGSFLVRNCESTTFNRYSLSLKSFRGCIHIRIEPNSLGTFSLGDQEFPSVPHLVLHFMSHRLPIKGAEHVRLMYPVITQLL